MKSKRKAVEATLGKARTVFRAMDKLWKSKIIRRGTKIRISNSNVKAILLHASQSWTFTENNKWATSLNQHMSMHDCLCTLARQHQQQ